MLESIFILLRFSVIFFFLLPLVIKLSEKTKAEKLNVVLMTFGISLGLGSYFLFLTYLFIGKFVTQTTSFAFFALIFLFSFLIFKKETLIFLNGLIDLAKKNSRKISGGSIVKFFFDGPIGMIRVLVLLLLLYVSLRGIFFPISQWDDLVRYAAWGSSIFARGEIGPLIHSYPLLVPLLYTYGFLSSDFRNDYLIKLIPLTFGFLTLALVYIMANDFFERRKYVGLFAIFFTLCFVPFFDWFHLGYVDIASAFYFCGTFYFLYLFSKTKFKFYLLVTGLFLGLSLWSKQQTMVIFLSLGLTSLLLFLNKKKQILDLDLDVSPKDVLAAIIISIPIFLPWYLRDLLIVGTPFQIPVLVSEASLETLLLPFIFNSVSVGNFPSAFFQISLFFAVFYIFKTAENGILFKRKYLWFIGIILVLAIFPKIISDGHPGATYLLNSYQRISLMLGVFLLVYSFFFPKTLNFRLRSIVALTLVWLLPYYLVWWLKYTTVFRYLITIIPLFVILFIFAADKLLPILNKNLRISKISELLIIILVVGFVLPRFSDVAMLKNLNYLFSDVEIRNRVSIDNGQIVGEYMNALPTDGTPKVISTDNRLLYYSPRMDFHNVTPAYLSDLINFDYYVLNPWTKEAYDLRKSGEKEVYENLIRENPRVFQKIYENLPYKVYKIVLSSSDFSDTDKVVNNIKDESQKMLDQKIEQIGLASTPEILPGDWRYKLKRLKDEWTLFTDKVFYNRKKGISFIASKRLLEAYEVCLYKNNCEAAKEPLMSFKKILRSLNERTTSEKRLLIDENFYTFSELKENFLPWAVILRQLSEKDNSISDLAGSILEDDFYSYLTFYEDNITMKEPNFEYFNKNGEKVSPQNLNEN